MFIMISVNELAGSKVIEHIIKYLKSKGKVRACLLHKLEIRFCKPGSKIRVKKKQLISCLILMMKKRIIDIIIPEPFQIQWRIQNLKNLNYLKDGRYYVRKFPKLNNELLEIKKKRNYYFDSRILNFDNKKLVFDTIENLKIIIKKVPELKYKTIIYYPHDSEPLNIYETFEGNYNLNFLDFKSPIRSNKIYDKLQIDLEEQKLDLSIIQSYRIKFMCMYITLIESIHKAIMDIQENKILTNDYEKKFRGLVTKFGYYCDMYVRSDWIDIEPNPYRWESFFKTFDLPFKIINISFNNIKFYGRTFEFWVRFNYCIFIEKKFKNLILLLKKLGYEEFKDENYDNYIAIGVNHEVFEPCPSIEYFYFLNKYVFYYHLFYLFYHCFEYIKKIKTNIKFTYKERELYKTFLPVMESFFNVQDGKIVKKLIFNYYTYNPDELDIIYNKFLLNNVKKIEKKLFNYFIIKCSK